MSAIILDAEMTGINNLYDNNRDELLQLSIINKDKKILFNEYFKPEKIKEWKDTEKIHGITPKFVNNKLPFTYYKEEIQFIINNAETIIGYSIDMDLNFLRKNGIEIENKKIIDIANYYAAINDNWSDFFDSFKLKSLKECAEFFKYDWNKEGINSHNSLGDCFATLYCYNKLATPQIYEVIDYKIKELKQDIFDSYEVYFDYADLNYIITKAIDCTEYRDYIDEIDMYEPLFDNWLLGEFIDPNDVPSEKLGVLYDDFFKEHNSNFEGIYYSKDINKIRSLNEIKNELDNVIEKKSLLEKAPPTSKEKKYER